MQDVVHLQEVWCRHDADLILAEAAKGQLKHGHHFIAGHFGSGLVTLSRFPLKQVSSWPSLSDWICDHLSVILNQMPSDAPLGHQILSSQVTHNITYKLQGRLVDRIADDSSNTGQESTEHWNSNHGNLPFMTWLLNVFLVRLEH